MFERKNYFYPDLPCGYQISQYQHPIVGTGKLTIDFPDGTAKDIGITRLHLEMDAGKSLHESHADASLIDLNRSGVALMEIVSEPDIRSPEEAVLYLRKLRSILRYLGTCDGNMEEGSLRCDANVSVRRVGDDALGTRCEVKNVNSMRFVARAIEYEAKRQVEILEAGGRIDQETRLFDSARGETRSMRSKEEAHDYRYFPDPDLLPLELEEALVARIAATLPELPDEKKARFVRDYGLSPYDAGVLVAEAATADYFEAVARGRDAKQAANWVVNDLFGLLGKAGKGIEDSPVAGGQPGQAARPAQVRGDQRPDRQGRVRDHVRDRRRSRGHRRGARPEAGDRHGRDRGAGRRADRRQPRARSRARRRTRRSRAGSPAR